MTGGNIAISAEYGKFFGVRALVVVYKSYFALRAGVLKAFGVAEVLSLLAKKVPKETSPGIARKPAKKFVRQGAVVTRTALPSRCSNIRRLKTLANDFLTARFTVPKEQPRRAKARTTDLKLLVLESSSSDMWSGGHTIKSLADDFL